jgi:hypothetical protein
MTWDEELSPTLTESREGCERNRVRGWSWLTSEWIVCGRERQIFHASKKACII